MFLMRFNQIPVNMALRIPGILQAFGAELTGRGPAIDHVALARQRDGLMLSE